MEKIALKRVGRGKGQRGRKLGRVDWVYSYSPGDKWLLLRNQALHFHVVPYNNYISCMFFQSFFGYLLGKCDDLLFQDSKRQATTAAFAFNPLQVSNGVEIALLYRSKQCQPKGGLSRLASKRKISFRLIRGEKTKAYCEFRWSKGPKLPLVAGSITYAFASPKTGWLIVTVSLSAELDPLQLLRHGIQVREKERFCGIAT